MTDRPESELIKAARAGDEEAFARLYDRYQQRVRLVAWRVSHRPDWVDDLFNETWCRAFNQRTTYNSDYPFLVWLSGILRNVYREHCRKSHLKLTSDSEAGPEEIDDLSPEKIAHEAEVLFGLNECLGALEAADATIIRLRFFKGMPLRAVAKEVKIPEATLRETKLPSLLRRLRHCLEKKEIEFSEFFSAHGSDQTQSTSGE